MKLPKEMLDAAASRFLDGLLPEKFQPTQGETHTHRFMAYGRKVAECCLEAAGVPALLARIAQLEATAKPATKVYHLLQQDFYVDENGRTEPPSLVGTFSSLDALNAYAQRFWFDLIVDVRGKQFTSVEMRFEGTGKQYGAVYVECCDLDPATN